MHDLPLDDPQRADRLVAGLLREFLAPPSLADVLHQLEAVRAERDALRRLLAAALRERPTP